ncbi:MAG: hypothetical protein ACJAUM_003313 [Pseudomonadales bacterium]|jgi:hypothetical protein
MASLLLAVEYVSALNQEEASMINHLVEMVVHPNSATGLDESVICNPVLNYAENFHVSSIFDCSREKSISIGSDMNGTDLTIALILINDIRPLIS